MYSIVCVCVCVYVTVLEYDKRIMLSVWSWAVYMLCQLFMSIQSKNMRYSQVDRILCSLLNMTLSLGDLQTARINLDVLFEILYLH
jgi:hypothetical protein